MMGSLYSGAVPSPLGTGKTSLVFVGDSITWGHGLNQTQTWAYLLQQKVNAKTGLTPVRWGNASSLDICARYVHMDDTTTSPFNGGQPPGGGTLLGSSGATGSANGPFKDTTSNSAGGNVSGDSGYTTPCITLTSGNSITFSANFPTASATYYAAIRLEGSGAFTLSGSTGSGTAWSFSNTGLTGPRAISSFTGPSDAGVTHPMSITCTSGTVYITAMQITPAWPSNHVLVHIAGRNSYALSDFADASGSAIAQEIQNQTLIDPGDSGTSPVFVLSVGAVSMYDAANSRQLTPPQYTSQLTTLVTNLKTTGTNTGRVILTVPLLTGNPSSWPLLSSYTVDSYRQAIIGVAKSLGLSYIDLTQANLLSGDFQSDNLHPNASGAQKIANYYAKVLGLW